MTNPHQSTLTPESVVSVSCSSSTRRSTLRHPQQKVQCSHLLFKQYRNANPENPKIIVVRVVTKKASYVWDIISFIHILSLGFVFCLLGALTLTRLFWALILTRHGKDRAQDYVTGRTRLMFWGRQCVRSCRRLYIYIIYNLRQDLTYWSSTIIIYKSYIAHLLF